jgi:acetyl-CoA acetyltransferase family protein
MAGINIVGGARTPFGRSGGALALERPDDLAALVIDAALERARVAPDAVDEVIFGSANQAGEDNRNIARMAALLAGLPFSVPAFTVNRLCASSLTAIALAADQVYGGGADLVIAGGVQSMTRAPWVICKPGTPWAKPGEVADSALGWRFVNERFARVDGGKATLSMGETAEEVANLDGISRDESDMYALASQERASAAMASGLIGNDLIPVSTAAGEVARDECPRSTSIESLAQLRPAFRAGGIVTAGSASPLSDGAAAVVVASDEAVDTLGLVPRGRVVAHAAAGVAPSMMGLGPVTASQKALKRAGWNITDLEAVEINEAFAPQVLACIRRLELDPEIVNKSGGAIALGHPLGASGVRIVLSLLAQLQRTGQHRGLATMCVGVGQGVAMVLERV